jgi:GDP-L-fucose synthase
LTGPLESTSEQYSVAKIAGVKLCQAYNRQYGFQSIAAVPATIYGPGSDVNMDTAHVIGALIGKFHSAIVRHEKKVTVWGSGLPRREFLFIDDFVEACLFLADRGDSHPMINIGCGYDVTIGELAELIKDITAFPGEIVFDKGKPDGTMRKLMDNSRIAHMGWKPKVDLREGIRRTYAWYKSVAPTSTVK